MCPAKPTSHILCDILLGLIWGSALWCWSHIGCSVLEPPRGIMPHRDRWMAFRLVHATTPCLHHPLITLLHNYLFTNQKACAARARASPSCHWHPQSTQPVHSAQQCSPIQPATARAGHLPAHPTQSRTQTASPHGTAVSTTGQHLPALAVLLLLLGCGRCPPHSPRPAHAVCLSCNAQATQSSAMWEGEGEGRGRVG